MADMIPEHISAIDRPDPKVVRLYLLNSVLVSLSSCGIALPFVLLAAIPVFIRYQTMRYRIDKDGIGLSWGWLNRQESHITFDKIQDIHLHRSFLERWLGLGTIRIQTASGNMAAEITLFGLIKFDDLRDYLYDRMRIKDDSTAPTAAPAAGSIADDAVVAVLQELRDEVRRLRAEVGS
ncbi:MAG: putative membrane protein YdbT with pleckstrin-like domain [Myxococcota bacterium]|jgi:uncharacterized membrane protein YdbT with pleckstrin-like domain